MRFICLAIALFMAQPATAQLWRSTPESKPQLQLSFAPVVKQTTSSVVNVYGARIVQNPMAGYFDDPMLRRFLGERGFGGRTKERVQSSLGSGVIVSSDGLVITNHHVIANSDEVRVALSDKREYEADIVLRDERTDLAVLRLKSKGETFPALQFADSDALEVGDLVLAIGNPFGVGQTVTSGIVSALARTQVGVSDYQFFIQTDAAINPGNSGGALIDMSGKLVGINTAIYSRSGGNIGIGFAIPANMVRVVVESAQSGGKTVRRPWLGATFQQIDSEIAETLNLQQPQGVLVTKVMSDSPSARAGLKVGDVVTAVDGQEIADAESLGFRVATKPLGSMSVIEALRGGKKIALSVKLEAAPENIPREEWRVTTNSPFMGATVGNLSPALAEELRLDFNEAGVAVIAVENNSPAQQLGIKKGDIVRLVNGEKITTSDELKNALKQRARFWKIGIERNGRVITTVVTG